MGDKTPSERIAVLETAEQYDRRTLESTCLKLNEALGRIEYLERRQQEYDNMGKFYLRAAAACSITATSIGIWIDNIKAFIKGAIVWAVQ